MTKQELAVIAKRKLFAFPKLASGNQVPPHLKFIADKIQNAIENESKRRKLLIISTPPRHGKSELVSKHTPSWFLGNYPKKRVILASYGSDLANEFSDKARNVFSEWGPVLWNVNPSKTQFNKQNWDTDKGGGLSSAGISGPITGKGADLLIIDDYIKDYEDAESILKRKLLWNWWKSVSASRLHPCSTVIIVATRWHDDDLIGRLLKEYQEQKDDFPWIFQYINLPAVAIDDKDPLGRVEGQALWPARVDEAFQADIKRTAGPHVWAALHQGNPVRRGGNLFKSSWFRYFEFDAVTKSYLCYRVNEPEPIQVKKSEIGIHTYVDPALEIKTQNDPTGMAAWGYSYRHKVWLLLDLLIEKIEHSNILKAILMFAFKNNSSIIGIENEKIGKMIAKQSRGNDFIGGRNIPFREIKKGKIDKMVYAVPMSNYFESERVFLLKGAPWLAAYESELVAFPRGKHDECVDVTSMAAQMGNKLTVAQVLSNTE